jgi:hypothetical protein
MILAMLGVTSDRIGLVRPEGGGNVGDGFCRTQAVMTRADPPGNEGYWLIHSLLSQKEAVNPENINKIHAVYML